VILVYSEKTAFIYLFFIHFMKSKLLGITFQILGWFAKYYLKKHHCFVI